VARFTFVLAGLVGLAMLMPVQTRAQAPAPAPEAVQADDEEVGNVASVQGSATVTRKGVNLALKVQDPIFKGDMLRTGVNAALGITFDDETTFNLSANASITVDEFVYEDGGKNNSALFKIARGTIAFAAQQVAKTGDMKIETPSSTLGIRGTSGVVEVPEGATPGAAGEVSVKLYQDEDGRVGRIELFGASGGPRLGLLTRAASGFALRPGAGGRFAAVALTISPQQAARDRGFVQRAFATRSIGRQMVIQRRNQRGPGLQRPGRQQPGQRQNNLRQPNQPGQPGLRQPGQPRPGALPSQRSGAQPNRPGVQGQPRQGGSGAQGQPRVGNAPNPRQQNLQRQNLQRPASAATRQPVRRVPAARPSGKKPPSR
jgi:hypothetical protein